MTTATFGDLRAVCQLRPLTFGQWTRASLIATQLDEATQEITDDYITGNIGAWWKTWETIASASDGDTQTSQYIARWVASGVHAEADEMRWMRDQADEIETFLKDGGVFTFRDGAILITTPAGATLPEGIRDFLDSEVLDAALEQWGELVQAVWLSGLADDPAGCWRLAHDMILRDVLVTEDDDHDWIGDRDELPDMWG